MDLFGKFRKLDSSLQRGLDNGFARVFGGEVVPAEIDETLKQQVENSVMMDPDGNRWAPCHFVVNISQRDFDSLHQNHSGVEEDLSDRLQRFIRNSGWRTNSPVQVIIKPLEGMHSGQLKADSMFNAPPRSSDSSDFSDASSERSNASFHGAGYDSADSEYDESGFEDSEFDESSAEAADNGEEFDASARNQDSYDSLKAAHDEAEANSGEFAAQNSAQAAQNSADDSSAELADIVKPAPSSQYVWDNASGAPAGAGAAAAGTAAAAHSNSQARSDGGEKLTSEENNDEHPGESAYATDRIAQANEYAAQPPVSYPGTEALAHNVHREDPRNGASGERNQSQAKVTLILRDGSDRRHVLLEGSNVIGRGNGVDLRIPDTGVSRQHAEITWDGYDAVLTDLQSTNGTSVNDTPIENWLLADGDIIVMGHSEIEVQFH